MDWFGGRVSLGNLDLAGAVNKLSESVKNIEKNFDNALGLEDKPESSNEGQRNSAADKDTLSDPANTSSGPKEIEASELPKDGGTIVENNSETDNDPPKMSESAEVLPAVQKEKLDNVDSSVDTSTEVIFSSQEGIDLANDNDESVKIDSLEARNSSEQDPPKPESVSNVLEMPSSDSSSNNIERPVDENISKEDLENSKLVEASAEDDKENHVQSDIVVAYESQFIADANDSTEQNSEESGHIVGSPAVMEVSTSEEAGNEYEASRSSSASIMGSESQGEAVNDSQMSELSIEEALKVPQDLVSQYTTSLTKRDDIQNKKDKDGETEVSGDKSSSAAHVSDSVESAELEKVNRDLKMMEAALHGAARQSQAKADEIARLMNENEHLKAMIEDLRRKSNDAEIESLREEYHQRVATLERKVYALTKERDTLRREQSKKSDAAALLKEKDEIINQIMAEGEELSKKQASQEGQIRKLRGQVRELEEEKKGLLTKLQVEENRVESIKKDKSATEKLLQETIEKHQAELTVQKDYYTNALNAAKEAEALAEARVNDEARSELESSLREAGEREAMLVQALEELRLTLSRQEQQAAFREDMLRQDMEDLQSRYQASERRCEELITQVPESTRPLLRQIEAMQETTARRAEAWAAVERTLNSRLQEAEAKAAGAEEKERSMNERLSQTLSRINVLEAQISCLRTEQTQLTRSLEKERQRAAEHRQEYLAAKEEFDTLEGRANQLEEELRELKKKHKQELQESVAHREILQQELEQERTARSELERTVRVQSSDKPPMTKQNSALENGKLTRKLSSASSVGNIEESFFLQASLDSSSDAYLERRNSGEITMNPYYLKSMTPSTFEATLRQKEGELASYMSRLATMESIRDSLAEELVNMTEQCEKLRTEAATLPGIRAELEALRRRHAAALELMGERDEELEELRADIVDLKEMYREQVNLLVNKIQVLSTQIGSG